MARSMTLLVVGLALVAGARALGESEFVAPQPSEVVKAPGGSVRIWSESFRQIQDAHLGAAIITVEPRSLALPQYTDSPTLVYVLSGRARVGLITPVGIPTSVRHISEGDAWAIPAGWVRWIWNYDQVQPLALVAVADTSYGPKRGAYTPFHLIGAQRKGTGGVIHGFSKEILAHAWDVEEEDVEKLLEGQKDAGFVKLENEPEGLKGAKSNSWFGDFVYNLREGEEEVRVKNGGSLSLLNAFKLPILRQIGLSLVLVRLQAGGLLAPHYTSNAARLLYVTKGKGRVEIAYPDGRVALRTDLEEGDAVIVPSGFPLAVRADENEQFEWVSFAGSPLPIPAFLAGANSLYKSLPLELSSAAFGVERELEEKVRNRRLKDFAIFARRNETGGREGLGGYVNVFKKFIEDAENAIKDELIRLPSNKAE